jgi:hypothetical protein
MHPARQERLQPDVFVIVLVVQSLQKRSLLLSLLLRLPCVAATVTAGAHLLITSSPILHKSTTFAPSLAASTTAAMASASTTVCRCQAEFLKHWASLKQLQLLP